MKKSGSCRGGVGLVIAHSLSVVVVGGAVISRDIV